MFFVNAEWFFLSHRLPIGLAALEAGFRVSVMAPEAKGMGDVIRQHGIEFYPFPMSRSGTNPRAELKILASVRRLLRKLRPTILHNVTLKPVLYGTLASLSLRKCGVVNAVSGLGSSVIATDKRSSFGDRLLRSISLFTRIAGGHLIVQNSEDLGHFRQNRMTRPERVHLILGSGVARDIVVPQDLPAGAEVKFLFPARLLRDKGIGEYLQAATRLRKIYPHARFLVAGDIDAENITSIDAADIRTPHDAGIVTWLGHRSDILELMTSCHVVVLPSYREGFPKVLVEAMACGRAIVTTDVAGCRDAVTTSVNGLLCEARNADALTAAIEKLLLHPELIPAFGRAGRKRFEAEFTLENVVAETLQIYERVISSLPSNRATAPR